MGLCGDESDTKACCCFPLALGVLFASAFVAALGVYDVLNAAYTPYLNFFVVVTYILGGFKILAGLLGALAALLGKAKLAGLMQKCMHIILICIIAEFLTQWISWIYDMCANDWNPDNGNICNMVIFTLLNIFGVWIVCCLKNITKAFVRDLHDGGNGWSSDKQAEAKLEEAQDQY